MFIYEKDGALKFILEQGAQENLDLSNPDITITKESGKVEILTAEVLLNLQQVM